MKLLRVIIGTMTLSITACQDLPSFSRSGEVIDIAITDRVSAVTIQVNPGDEIRWTNTLMTPMRVTLLDYVLDKLSCRRNFSGHYYSGAETDLHPNESASLCFMESTYVRYAVRLTSWLSEGDVQGGSNQGRRHSFSLSAQKEPHAVLSGDSVVPLND